MNYYGSDEQYADALIMDAMSQNPVDNSLQGISTEDRTDLIFSLIQTAILLPAGIGSMMSAVGACKEGESFDLVVRHWDRAAAFLIGSIEGDQRGGDIEENGVGMFGLAKEVCWDFSSCSKSGNANANDKLVDNFSTGEQLI